MSGAIPSLPNMPSWHGAQLKISTGTTLPLPVFLHILPAPLYAITITWAPLLCTFQNKLVVVHSAIITQ
jgi:hypothetical protein